MGVVTIPESKQSVSGKRVFRPSSSIRHTPQWYSSFLHFISSSVERTNKQVWRILHVLGIWVRFHQQTNMTFFFVCVFQAGLGRYE